jgi:hypothetical protein
LSLDAFVYAASIRFFTMPGSCDCLFR